MTTSKKSFQKHWAYQKWFCSKSGKLVMLPESGVAAFVQLVGLVGIKNKN